MRLATFNILNGRSPADDQVNVDRFASAVRDLEADVLALQEVDRNQARSNHTDLTTIAAEAMDAPEHRFVAALAGTPGATWIAADGQEQPDAAAYGIALISRHPVSTWQVIRLDPAPVKVPMWFKRSLRPTLVRDEPRVAVVATIEAPSGPLTVVNTHLSFLDVWNGRQLRALVRTLAGGARAASSAESPLLLMGDLNMGPDRATRITGMRALADHLTFPAEAPTEQIDHVLTDNGTLQATHSAAVAAPLSDHRALVVDLA